MQEFDLQKVWDFLTDLSANNNKPWFDANKDRYQQALTEFRTFATELIAGLAQFDHSVAGLTVADCTYRIYRDLRFSLDKTPYKTHMGVYVCPQGKKSGNAGYYVHVEPTGECMLVAGLYMPSPQALKSVREEIMLNGKEFDKAVKQCRGFTLDWHSALKRIPNGWNAEDEFSEYYKLRDFDVMQIICKEQILSKNFLTFILGEYHKTLKLNTILNKSVQYAREEL